MDEVDTGIGPTFLFDDLRVKWVRVRCMVVFVVTRDTDGFNSPPQFVSRVVILLSLIVAVSTLKQ